MTILTTITTSLGIILMIIIFSLLWVVLWIYTLIHQAKRKRWVWFILTLLFNITILIYWIVRFIIGNDKGKRKNKRK